MTEVMIKLLKTFFATALNEANARIKPGTVTPTFYCEELGEFTGSDGRKYIVEVTLRPAQD